MSFGDLEKQREKWRDANAKYRDTDKGKKTNKKNQEKWKKENPTYSIEWNLKKRYDMTLDEWNKLFESQEGCCAICGRHQGELKTKLHVDHNHITGEIRGLVCAACNIALGDFRIDELGTDILYKAIEYLEK